MALKHLVVLLGLTLGVTACGPILVDYDPYGPGRRYAADPGVVRAAIDYASRTGYRDGFDAGVSDGRRGRDGYEPRSYRRFRSADHGYRRDLHVARDFYADHYRRGFLSGYDAGYREGREDRSRRWR